MSDTDYTRKDIEALRVIAARLAFELRWAPPRDAEAINAAMRKVLDGVRELVAIAERWK